MTYPGTAVTFEAPVAQKERITILDSLRGFAILGILLMNLHSPPLSHEKNNYQKHPNFRLNAPKNLNKSCMCLRQVMIIVYVKEKMKIGEGHLRLFR
jgi:uncharacterized membrane protein YeiB